jgi:16S rRNA (guanine527-N7)-methyltransferase
MAGLLAPFLEGEALSAAQLAKFSAYLDLLLRWNARINLTAVRQPREIVTRHFGESVFAARRLLPEPDSPIEVADLGSGAGFPGLPLKIVHPAVRLTLIESQSKKAVFLNEAIRTLQLENARVLNTRGETVDQRFELVTLRAVERFSEALPVAAGLLRPGGGLGLLIGAVQIEAAQSLLRGFQWRPAMPIPQSTARVLLLGANHQQQDSTR